MKFSIAFLITSLFVSGAFRSSLVARSSLRRFHMLSETSTPDSSVTNTTPSTEGSTAAPVTDMSVKDPVEINSDAEFELDFEALSKESATTTFKPKRDLSDMYVKDAAVRKAPRQAKWFPMLLAPTALDGSLAGDVGFDPLGFSKDKESLKWMREAEMKHSRLAMLGAAGWPLSELWHKGIADTLGLDSILADADKAPSVLNGGLSNAWIIATGAIAILIGGLLELRTKEMVSDHHILLIMMILLMILLMIIEVTNSTCT